MRREHHPFWVQKAMAHVSQRWAEHFLLPQFDVIGREPRFSGARFIHVQGGNIRIGDHFHAFATRHAPISLAVNPYEGGDGELVIGNWVVISMGARIRSATSVRIGDNTMLAENCYITDADWHDVYHRIYPGKRAPVVIGNNVWLADSVTVCKGVTIGDNCVIGAASVVTRDLPPNTIAAGNPAKPIGEIDPSLPSSRREHLFDPRARPYDAFKDEYDQKRLEGNTLRGYVRAWLRPRRDD